MAYKHGWKYKLELQKKAREAKWTNKWKAIEGYRKKKQKSKANPVTKENVTPEVAVVHLVEQPVEEKPAEEKFMVEVSEQEIKKEVELLEIPEEPQIQIEPVPITPESPFGFPSEFVFRLPSGEEVGRARDLDEFTELLRRSPLDSVLYHANEEHFSAWLESQGHKKLAKTTRNIKGNSKKARKKLLKIISKHLERENLDTRPSYIG